MHPQHYVHNEKGKKMTADIKWLDDPEIFRVNQRDAHSDHVCYASKEEAKLSKSSLYQCLNGEWRFCYSKNAMERPVDFYRKDFDDSSFDSITVPGHIEIAGYDKIHYINTLYPWEGHEYRRPAYTISADNTGMGMFSQAKYNPVGSYLTTFSLEKGLQGKSISICFEGVEQAMYLWLNGHFVGYAEDSFTPSEFDLTPYLEEENTLAVEVHKRSSAAFLEGQDFFRFFGIFRNVTLVARAENHLEDMWLKPRLLDDYSTGTFEADFSFEEVTEGSTLQVAILAPSGELIFSEEHPLEENMRIVTPDFANVKLWNNKTPHLYTLELLTVNEDGQITGFIPYSFGFRRIEIKDKVILLNGKRHIINGTNRHEWNPRTGRAITIEDMDADIEIFKRNNINSVRTSHYPFQIPWYFKCDKEGIYVMAETNLESHGSFMMAGEIHTVYNVPGNIPQWLANVIDRARTNYKTFRNHTSVLFWSLGNESYAEENIRLMNVFFKENDPDRLVHYEGNHLNPEFEDSISDIKSRMYPFPNEIREYLDNNPKKPYIICEYMHDMGNSLGGMKSYMDLLDEYEMYQGGYIWDFIDQALYVQDEVTKKEVLRYGGDFDDRPSDYEFSGNGLVFANRQEKPALQEVKYYYGKYSE
jgi:beta-galactosidase